MRGWEAWESSLWLDELHTLFHASQPDLRAVAESVRREFHTPLFFMGVHLLGGWEQSDWLRVLPVLSSLVVLWPLMSLTRCLGGGARAVFLVAWLYACLPYQVHWASELRPYAWLGLLSAAAVQIAFAESTGRGSHVLRFFLFFACVLLGLFTHRVMAVTVLAIGVARVLAPGPGRLGLGWLILAGTLGVAPSVPWMMSFAVDATTARFDYQEEVGGYQLRPQLVKEVLALPLRIFVPYMGALGGVWALLAKLGTAALFGSFGWGLVCRWIDGPADVSTESRRLLRGLWVFVIADFVAVTALSVYTWDRAPLQYYAGLAWLLPLLAGSLLLRRDYLVASAAVAALMLGIAQAGGQCTEDMRRAVHLAEELGGEYDEPIFTALLSQPTEVFDHVLPYRAYARELEAVEPEDLPQPGEVGFERVVICLRRGAITYGSESWAPITNGRRLVLEERVDEYLTVFVLEPEG